MLHTSEQFASENVVHVATDRREQREVPAALPSTGVKKNRKKEDPQRVNRVDPQRVEKSGPTAGRKERTHRQVRISATMSTRQKQPDASAATSVQISSVAAREQDLAFHRAGRERQDKTHLREVTATKEQTIRSMLPTTVIKTSLRMREKTVEVPQIHDIDEIVRRCCAETEEGLKRPKKMNP